MHDCVCFPHDPSCEQVLSSRASLPTSVKGAECSLPHSAEVRDKEAMQRTRPLTQPLEDNFENLGIWSERASLGGALADEQKAKLQYLYFVTVVVLGSQVQGHTNQ